MWGVVRAALLSTTEAESNPCGSPLLDCEAYYLLEGSLLMTVSFCRSNVSSMTASPCVYYAKWLR